MELEVEGKNVVIVDDMVDTAGTLTKAADLMIEKGAKSVKEICTLLFFLEMLMKRKTLN